MQAARQLVVRGGSSLRSVGRIGGCVECRAGFPILASSSSLPRLPHTNTIVQGVCAGRRCGEMQVNTKAGVSRRPSPSLTVTSAHPHPHLPMIQVSWEEGESTEYPYVWLRDNCQCPSCFHSVALARIFRLSDLQLSVRPSQVQVGDGGGSVEVTWQDGHLSSFPSAWLHQRAFSEDHQRQQEIYSVPRVFWGSELSETFPKASFTSLLKDDQALLDFLTQFEAHGVGLVSDAPRSTGQLHVLAPRVGHLVPSHYGDTFHVMTKSDPSNLAYTSGTVDLHCDLPSRSAKPEIQLLHCIIQTTEEGGENILSDGIHAAARFKKDHPSKFHLLSTTPIEFCDRGNDEGYEFHIVARKPVIVLDYRGEVKTINMHTMSRSSYIGAKAEDVEAWYDALMSFNAYLHDPKNSFCYKMKEGDILVMDNMRLLHGRSAYKAAGTGKRHLEGGYWAWAEVASKRRLLQQNLGRV